jgi:SAM-dependent methyltransferase
MSALEFIRPYSDRSPQQEWDRLDRHPTEFALACKALEAYLPPAPARVLDCGGGPGRYAIRLAQRGYAVTLFDPSPENLAFARRQARAAGVDLQSYDQGDAAGLSRYAAGSFDAILMMGPLVHLLELQQRQRALGEARRVLRPGGTLFAAFMAHPSEVGPLLWSTGFEHLETLNLEGLAAGCQAQVSALQGAAWDAWLAINWGAACDPRLLGAGQRLLAVARQPLWRAALRKLALELQQAGIRYTLAGGANLALHGVPLPVKDLDLEMSAADAGCFQQRYAAFATMPVALRQDERYRSYFGRFEIDGVLVEVMGDLQRREGDAWKPTANQTREALDMEGVSVWAAWLEEETLANLRRGRLERAALCLPYCHPERLAALLTGQITTDVL